MVEQFNLKEFLQESKRRKEDPLGAFQETKLGRTITRSRGGAGRAIRPPTPSAPTPTFPSTILGKTFASAAARATAEATFNRTQAEARIAKSRARTERARQARAGTIAGQLEAQPQITQPFIGPVRPQPRARQVGLPGSAFEQAAFATRPDRIKSESRFGLGLIREAGRQFFFIGGTPVSAVGTLVSPFQKFFTKDIGTLPVPSGVSFGTISTQQLPRGAGQVRPTTGFEIAKGEILARPETLIPAEARATGISQQISSGLVSELQPRIDIGDITVKQAEQQFEEQFPQRFAERAPEIESSIQLRKQLGTLREPVVDVRRSGELVGILASSLTPFGRQAFGASIVASGLPKVTGGKNLLERGIGLAEIGVGLGVGGLAIRQAERAADISLVQELQAKQGFVVSKELFKSPKGAFFTQRSIKQFGPEAILKTETKFPVFKIERPEITRQLESGIPQVVERQQQFFSITGGKGVSELKFFSIEKGKFIKTREQFGFQVPKIKESRLAPSLDIPGQRLRIAPLDEKGFFGTGIVTKKGQETFRQFAFGGTARDVESQLGRFTLTRGGELTGLRLREPLVGKPQRLGIFKVTEKGLIGRLGPEVEEGVKFLSPAGTKRTPFQTTFQQQISPPPGLLTQLERQVVSPRQIFKPSRTRAPELGIGLQRGLGGAGLTQQQIQRSQGLIPRFEQQEQILPPISRRGGGLTFISLVDERSLQLPASGTLLGLQQGRKPLQLARTLQGQVSGLSLKSIQSPRLAQRQRQEQLLSQKQLSAQQLAPQIARPRPGFGFGFGGGGFPLIPFPPSLGRTPTPKKRKTRRRTLIPTRPSFTGIILDIEKPAVFLPFGLGVSPFSVRGLRTGFDIAPSRKKKKKKKK